MFHGRMHYSVGMYSVQKWAEMGHLVNNRLKTEKNIYFFVTLGLRKNI